MPPVTNPIDFTFKAPRATLGLMVKWSPGLGHDWYPAIVTRTGGNAIDLSVFAAGAQRLQPHSSARHRDDPAFPKLLDHTGGIWDFTDEHKLLAALSQVIFPDENGYQYISTQYAKSLRLKLDGLVYTPEPDEQA